MRKQQTNPTGRTKTLRRPTHTQAFEVMEFQVNLKTCKGQNRPRSCDSQIYYTVLDWKYYTVLDWIYYTILDWIPEQKKKKNGTGKARAIHISPIASVVRAAALCIHGKYILAFNLLHIAGTVLNM